MAVAEKARSAIRAVDVYDASLDRETLGELETAMEQLGGGSGELAPAEALGESAVHRSKAHV